MSDQNYLEVREATKKPRKFIATILVLTLIAASISLISFVITGRFPCTICFDYPDWWKYAYLLKSFLAILSVVLVWRWRKIGVYGLVAVSLINAVSLLMFEYDVLMAAASLLSIAVLYIAISNDWADYQ